MARQGVNYQQLLAAIQAAIVAKNMLMARQGVNYPCIIHEYEVEFR